MQPRAFTFITGPRQAHGARTPDEYLEIQRTFIARLAASGRAPVASTYAAPDGAAAYVSGGRWKVKCPCGNAPSASPEWDLACCLECGAIFRRLAWPPERAQIEALLLARPAHARHWRPGETVAFLEAENAEHGVSR